MAEAAKQPRKPEKVRTHVLRRKTPAPRGSAKDEVFEAVRANPGRLGTEIATIIANTVNKNTVRTQLRRLRMEGQIEQSEQRWFIRRHRAVA
jgi:predicted transcriptional regulator